MRRLLLVLIGLSFTAFARAGEDRFSTVGIYIGPPKSNDVVTLPFLKACGYNYLEFCETGFAKRPDQLPEYYAQMMVAAITLLAFVLLMVN